VAPVSVRTRLRRLPQERRRDVVAALREGRAVRDPRDAPLAVALAERPARNAGRWPVRIWIQPRSSRERIERTIHVVILPASLAYAMYVVWSNGGWVHWAVLAWLVLSVTSIPAYVQTFRVLRNAPAALEANRAMTA
jgi:hypothetical protein